MSVVAVLPPSTGVVFADAAVAELAIVAVGDPGRTRTVYAAIAFLVAIGVGLLVLAGWLVRSTRVDPEFLAPLELMGDRAWRSGDPVWQRRRLDEVRPVGAEPLSRMAPPPLADPDFDRGPAVSDFSDFDDLLRELGVEVDDGGSNLAAAGSVDDPPVPGVVEVDPFADAVGMVEPDDLRELDELAEPAESGDEESRPSGQAPVDPQPREDVAGDASVDHAETGPSSGEASDPVVTWDVVDARHDER